VGLSQLDVRLRAFGLEFSKMKINETVSCFGVALVLVAIVVGAWFIGFRIDYISPADQKQLERTRQAVNRVASENNKGEK